MNRNDVYNLSKDSLIFGIEKILNDYIPKEWLSLKEAAKYAGVSYNTFVKFRHKGLKVCEIEGVKRVSKKEINRFLEEYSI
ncbi:helix-turn-helix domain-containing protein [Lysinibacillus sp. 1P01SD]|uniref:helix-turn-helix domain-containing protein n=1 Tax=Lysinibacillus sp. 1P01SD TaxID=3132285 RepID=UPI0039A19EE5